MFEKCIQNGLLILAVTFFTAASTYADLADMSHLEDDTRIVAASVGYRGVDTDDNAHRAAEYSYIEDSATFNLLVKRDQGDRAFSLTADFYNKNDYLFEGSFDYKALFRLQARTERMYHNLDHIPYNSSLLGARQPSSETTFEDHDINQVYGKRITIDEVKVRGKLPEYPAHINLGFWRMEKKGKEQLRFVDENCAGSCHMQSTTRSVNRVTEEVKAGIDAHLGPVDIAFLQTLRQFKEKGQTPNDTFQTHTLRFFGPPRSLDHDEIPDATLSESILMVNLPPSGGFVASASYTIGKRENESDLSTVAPVEAATDYQKLATDVTYTPGEKWTMNFRYRMLEMDSDVPSSQTSDGVASPANPFSFSGIPVRPSIDIDRNNYAAYLSYRPDSKTTFKGEFERETVDRSNTGIGEHHTFDGVSNPNWAVPSDETTDRYRLSFNKRMLDKSALKLSGWYEHVNTDNPAYSTTLSSSNELFLSATFRPSTFWGATGSINILRGENDDRTVTQFYDDDDDGTTLGVQVPFDLKRKEESNNFSMGAWFIPNDIISTHINYGLSHLKIEQDVLFGAGPDPTDPGGVLDFTIQDNNADYKQTVQTLSAGINLRLLENVNCRLEGYHIRSNAEFSPGFDARDFDYFPIDTVLDTATADELSEISEVDIRQNGIKARLTWKLNEMLTAGLEYTFDDYDDRNSSVFDGSAQMLMASLAGTF